MAAVGSLPQHFVYVENVHGYGIRNLVFIYRGSSLAELLTEAHNYLPMLQAARYDCYTAPLGIVGRHLCPEHLDAPDSAVYIYLRGPKNSTPE